MTDEKKRFAVISNPNMEEERLRKEDKYNKARLRSYQTNPLREQFVRFANEDAGRKFSIEDLLKW